MMAIAWGPVSKASGAASTGSASGTQANGTPIKIGFVYPVTGTLASLYANAPDGLTAYFNAVNKEGGYLGHPFKLIVEDDQSSPTGAQNAVKVLLGDNLTAMVSGSPFFFTAAKSVQEAGIPVIGTLTDGPEWGQQPYTNMFDLRGGINPEHEGVGDITAGPFFKSIGVKKLASLAIGISPSAISSAKSTAEVATSLGIDMAYVNMNLPFGPFEATPTVLQMKAAGVQGVYCVCAASTFVNLITSLRQEGVKIHPLSFSGVDYSVFSAASTAAAVQGVYYNSFFPPAKANSQVQLAEKRLATTVPGFKVGQIPSYTVTGSYNAAQLIDKGLEGTGKSDPTPKEVVSSLQKVSNWNADGLLPSPVSFTHFGKSESHYCSFFVKGKGNGFVFLNGGKTICVKTPADLR